MPSSTPRIAVVYDRLLTHYGGAENVLKHILTTFPTATLITSLFDAKKVRWAEPSHVTTTWLQRIPFFRSIHRAIAWLMPTAFESVDVSDYDIIISVTSAEAKGVMTQPHQLHICYLLTPTRYLYSHHERYLASIPRVPGLAAIARALLGYLRWWDVAAASRPDVILAISNRVAQRAEEHYRRSPDAIIYPPVNPTPHLETPVTSILLENGEAFSLDEPFALVVSRLVPYKKVDVAIAACEAVGYNLLIIGEGPQKTQLRRQAKSHTFFAKNTQQSMVQAALASCSCFIMVGEEDFGIAAMEAASLQKPVILHGKSGAAELLPAGVVAIHLQTETSEELQQALQRVKQIKYDTAIMKSVLKKTNPKLFSKRLASFVNTTWQHYTKE